MMEVKSFSLRHQGIAWLLLLPVLVLISMFICIPIVTTGLNSFFVSVTNGRSNFVGLENYRYLLSDEVFFKAMKNNLLFMILVVPCSVSLSFIMALWVHARLAGHKFMRLAYFIPTILPMIAVANIWLFFFTPQYGFIEQIIGFFGKGGINWLGSEKTALLCIIVVSIWKDAGFFMIFYLAGLQHISPRLGEAAILEGASRWYYIRKVLLPLLGPTTLFVLVNAIINAFRMVDHIFVLTKGGPNNASTLLLYYIYEVSFQFFDIGYGAALTMILLLVIGIIAIFQFFVLEQRVHYR